MAPWRCALDHLPLMVIWGISLKSISHVDSFHAMTINSSLHEPTRTAACI